MQFHALQASAPLCVLLLRLLALLQNGAKLDGVSCLKAKPALLIQQCDADCVAVAIPDIVRSVHLLALTSISAHLAEGLLLNLNGDTAVELTRHSIKLGGKLDSKT